MAIVGDAYIVVKAITTGFESEVRRAAKNTNLDREGRGVGDSFSRGFSRGVGSGMNRSFDSFRNSAMAARKSFQALVRASYLIGPAITIAISSIGALVSGLASLASSLVAAAPAAITLVSALTSLAIAAIGLKAALSGVGKAISAGTKANLAGKKSTDAVEQAMKRLLLATERVTEAQKEFSEAVKEANEEIQQLGFDAEDAALAESKAAIELEKARETLQRVQDLPPNARARREANLAFEEAELNLRRAKDRNVDLRKEQERLAQSAVNAGIKLSSLSQEDQQKALAEQTDTYLNAQKRLIDALRDQKEAEDDLTKAKKGTADKTFQDALSDLSKEAQEFVKYMVNTFIPSLKTLRDALGEQLFSQLESNLERLRTVLFPALRPVLVQLGNDIGKAFTLITDGIVKPENIDKLNKVIIQSGISIKSYATTLSNLYESFLTVLVAATPLINRFNKFLENKTAGFADRLNLQEASGELTKFFDKAGDIAGKLGSIFGNTFRTISNITKANFAPGGGGYILIDWLKEVTNRWDSFTGSVTGQTKLTDYFKAVAINSKAALQGIGAYIKEVGKAGADPNVGKFWLTLKTGAPAFGDLLKAYNAAGPALAEFIVAFIKFSELTVSSGAISTFLKVLTIALNALSTVLNAPGMQQLFNMTATIFAVALAFGTMSKILSFAGKVISGSFLAMGGAIKFLLHPLRSLMTAYLGLGPVITSIATTLGFASAGPFLAAAAIVAALVAVMVIAYNKSEALRTAFVAVGQAVKDVFDAALKDIVETFKKVFGEGTELNRIFEMIGDVLSVTVMPVIGALASIIVGTLGGAVQGLIKLVGALVAAFRFGFNLIKTIVGVVVGAFTGDWKMALDGLKGGLKSFLDFFKYIFGAILMPFRGAINGIINAWNSMAANFKVKIPDWIPKAFGGGQTFSFNKINPIPNFAQGGTVYPSSAGTLARVAEAGRPERIEPLDPDGLSKRDKAMISLLSGGKGSGMTVNVYPSPGMDETELASLVSRQIAFQLRRGGA